MRILTAHKSSRWLSSMCGVLAIASSSIAGCASQAGDDDSASKKCGPVGGGKADGDVDPYVMPGEIVMYERAHGWGKMHVEFHVERRWELMGESGQAWAKSQGFKKADLQEGQATNGLEFLAMHRNMLRELRARFPSDASLFAGWDSPPTDPKDPKDALPDGSDQEFDPNMLKAIDHVGDKQIGNFADDDAFGNYLQTNLTPTPDNPTAESDDLTRGLHNYLHVRFTDDSSAINVGDPSVNLENQLFWRLHGWIDARWTAFRLAKGLNDETDTTYLDALANTQQWMHDHMDHAKADGEPTCIDVPMDVTKHLF